jgi:photosystem II stability/assembly factor-like uncharacterized protein
VRRAGTLGLAAFLSLISAEDARANGRYPSAGLVVFDPAERERLAVRTTFGALVSRDGGRTFDYVCESALRLGVEEDPMLAFTATGRLVVATFGGVLSSDDACSYSALPELDGQVVPDLARSGSDPDRLVAFRLLGKGGGLYESAVVRSDDGARSFRAFEPLDETLLPVTIDVAAREPSRVYLSARRGVADGYDSVLLVSDDGGENFRERPVPGTAGQDLAYIAGVHPGEPDRLALRVNHVERTTLYETRDGGETFEILFEATGRLTGFAYSPDGAEVAFGGLDEGLYGGSLEELVFERRSDVAPTCLGWNDDGLWACADVQTAGFSFGRSRDAGRTFEPLLVFAELCGRSTCDAASDVGALCGTDWQNVAPSLAATCGVDGGAPARGGEGGDGPDESGARTPGGGCDIASPPRRTAPGMLVVTALGTLVAARRGRATARRRERPARATARAPRPRW